MSVKVFISHSHKDDALYSALCIALDSSSVSRWDVSSLPVGNSLSEQLRFAIEECDLCVFIASRNSIESSWCHAELGAFWGAGKKVIIYQADNSIEEDDLPPQFKGILWASDANRLLSTLNNETGSDRVSRMSNGYSTRIGGLDINVIFGRIEEFDYSNGNCLVALPANEYFDDECIHDKRSALGSFMQHHFPNRIPEIQELVVEKLQNEKSINVFKRPKEKAKSFGVGKTIFIDRPLSENLRIAMVSVTTQRENEGLQGQSSYIFKAARSIQGVMANNRYSILYLPILGSGHGGLKQELSLLCILSAFSELRSREAHNLKELNIIVYRHNEESPPSIPEKHIEKTLQYLSGIFDG